MGFIAQNYGVEQTSPLMTDKYHLTTAYGYWLEGRADHPSVFYMFGRKEAGGSGYTVAAGLEGVIDIVRRWQEYGFTDADLAYLRGLKTSSGTPQFPDAFIDYLSSMTFKLRIDAAPEGSVFFPQEPVLRVAGPIVQVKMLESVALCLMNGHGAYATQAARQISVIGGDMANGSPSGTASIQGLRRGPGLGAAIESSRSLALGGYSSTSTGTAAKLFGTAFAGTMDHAWVMTHRAELGDKTLPELFALQAAGKTEELQQSLAGDAFRSFAFAYPDSGVFLLDTYDPLRGLEHAIVVIKELRAMGRGAHYGLRFDSGDITGYSKHALRRLAEEGFVTGIAPDRVASMDDDALLLHAENATVFCVAADGIDEYTAQDMRRQGGFFKAWGIGTAGSHVPPLGLVYKASSVYMDDLDDGVAGAMVPVMKVASNAPVKSSNPGVINSRRYYNADGTLDFVLVYDETAGLSAEKQMVDLRDFSNIRPVSDGLTVKDLLVPVFDGAGSCVYPDESIAAMNDRLQQQMASLPEDVRSVSRSADDILKSRLLSLFKSAKQAGEKTLSIDIAQFPLPDAPKRIPVFLDLNLFRQRMACEERHLARASRQGVGEYEERFEQSVRSGT